MTYKKPVSSTHLFPRTGNPELGSEMSEEYDHYQDDHHHQRQQEQEQQRQHPLLLLRPPATDYLTYLTLIEHLLLIRPEPSSFVDTGEKQQEENRNSKKNNIDYKYGDHDESHTPVRPPTSIKNLETKTTTSPPSFSYMSTVRLLHGILRGDESLTAGIGWDLVQILLPHVGQGWEEEEEEEEEEENKKVADEAEACLMHIARCGNPREVVLKVGEGLWRLGRLSGKEDGDSDRELQDDGSDEQEERKDDGDDDYGEREEGVGDESDALNANRQFTTLLAMLAVLHQRIKTKRPSRFLSSSLQAVLTAYELEDKSGGVGKRRRWKTIQKGKGKSAAGLVDFDERIAAAVAFVKSVSGVRRPRVPERAGKTRGNLKGFENQNSSGDKEDGGQSQVDKHNQQHEPDPEADMSEKTGETASVEVKDELSNGEISLQRRLLQSFVTHLLSRYIMATEASAAPELSDLETQSIEGSDTPKKTTGLAWSIRLLEKLYPKRWGNGISIQLTPTSHLDEKEYLQRQATIGELDALSRDLDLTDDELKAAILETTNDNGDEGESRKAKENAKVNGNSGKGESQQDLITSELDPPDSAGDVPLCREGALYLLASRATAGKLYGNRQQQECEQAESGSIGNNGNNVNSEEKKNVGMSADRRDRSVISLFPEHNHFLKSVLPTSALPSIGNEPAPVIDALCALGIVAFIDGSKPIIPRSRYASTSIHFDFSTSNLSGFPDTADFQSYIQTLSLIAATNPDPKLRAVAHYLATSVLHAHPSASVRLLIIRDVLEHCPFQNLKESAVGWLKDEIANAVPVAVPGSDSQQVAGLGIGISDGDASQLEPLDMKEVKVTRVINAKRQNNDTSIDNPEIVDEQTNIFATPTALATTASFLFPDLTDLSDDKSHKSTLSSSYSAITNNNLDMSFIASVPLHIATLNLLYLLLSAPRLRDTVDMSSLLETHAVERKFLGPLQRYCMDKILILEASIAEEQVKGELRILSMTVDRVKEILEGEQ